MASGFSGRSICRAPCRITRAKCTRGTSPVSCCTSHETASSSWISTTRSFAIPASPTPGRYARHDRQLDGDPGCAGRACGGRLLVDAVRVCACDVHRTGGDPASLPAALYAAHVPHERDLGHRRGRVDRRHRCRLPADDSHHRSRRAVRLHDQHRQRVPDHGPDAEDVQEAMMYGVAQFAAVVATALFIFSLYWMNDPKTARRGVIAGVTAMLVAVVATWVQPQIIHHAWIVAAIVLGVAVALGVVVVLHPTAAWSAHAFYVIVGLAVLFGVLLIIPIGGADMPTVISILNSYAGLSAVAMGFVLNNKLLVTAGALDGSSGLILSIIMCRAMNRSFSNVLFGAFGTVQKTAAIGEQKEWKQETVEGAAQLLEQASRVVVIPGYGMAVAQGQHKVRELYDQLTKRGVTVQFAIHPVAGRDRKSTRLNSSHGYISYAV